jgi:hypothetical protein
MYRLHQLADSFHPDDGDAFLRNLGSLQEPQGVTSQETAFFIVTAVETSNSF